MQDLIAMVLKQIGLTPLQVENTMQDPDTQVNRVEILPEMDLITVWTRGVMNSKVTVINGRIHSVELI